MVMNTVYLPWTLAAIRRSRGHIVFSQTISPKLRLIIIHRWLEAGGCALQWDPYRRSLIVVPASPRPYPNHR